MNEMKFIATKKGRTSLPVYPKTREDFNAIATWFLNRGYVITIKGEGL